MNTQNSSTAERLQTRMDRFIHGPAHPQNTFLFSGCTHQDVAVTARKLSHHFSGLSPNPPALCLATQNRAILAAAVRASLLERGFHLLLPYSGSSAVLHEMHQQVPYGIAITDEPLDLPDGVTQIRPDEISGWPDPAQPPAVSIDLHQPFLQLFTGGSTGKPKIWPKTVENLFAEAFFLAEKFDIRPEDRIVATVPPFHIYGMLFSVLLPLIASASVAADTPVFPHEIADCITAHRATVLVSVPVHYRTIGTMPLEGHALRLAFSSAGALNPEDGKNFFRNSGVGVTEIYGSTETGGIACRCRAAEQSALICFETVDVKIIDDAILVRSDYISPNLPRDRDGYFRTGDRGRPLDTDRFVLHGRSDGIVKIGGKRVDLEEIREKIRMLPGVSDAVIVAVPHAPGRENEIAAMVEGTIPFQQIRRRLADILEPYARPKVLRVVEQIPRNTFGKYDMDEVRMRLQPATQRSST